MIAIVRQIQLADSLGKLLVGDANAAFIDDIDIARFHIVKGANQLGKLRKTHRSENRARHLSIRQYGITHDRDQLTRRAGNGRSRHGRLTRRNNLFEIFSGTAIHIDALVADCFARKVHIGHHVKAFRAALHCRQCRDFRVSVIAAHRRMVGQFLKADGFFRHHLVEILSRLAGSSPRNLVRIIHQRVVRNIVADTGQHDEAHKEQRQQDCHKLRPDTGKHKTTPFKKNIFLLLQSPGRATE